MTAIETKAEIIHGVCQALTLGKRDEATAIARARYAFNPSENAGRRYSPYQLTRLFVRDGFIDRYSGTRLVFPGTLRLLSVLMPEEFPAHPNWKMRASHPVYWELFPTLDHVTPIARGGLNDESNWVTTSMLMNPAKANWTLEELGWSLRNGGRLHDWDGLVRWFLDYTRENPTTLQNSYLRRWRAAALRALETESLNEV